MESEQLRVASEENIKVYGYRWVVLVAYMLATVVIQLLWASFFSITTEAWEFYGFTDAVKGENAISLLSIIFMVGMIVLSVPSLAAFEKWGLKKAVGFGAVLAGVAGLLRGLFGDNYTFVLVMTVLLAVAQPFILNAPGLIAGRWFPENERATANGVGLLANYVGIALGLLLSPILLGAGLSIKGLLNIYGIVAVVVAVIFVLLVKDKPPTPPCAEEDAERVDFVEGLKTAFKKKNFLLTVIMFFFMLGVFNTFFTMIEPLMTSMTKGAVGATEAGIIGVIVLVTGIVGSFVVSMFSDKDKRQRRLPYMIAANVVGVIGMVLFILLSGYTGMIIAAVVYGFFTIGSAPVVLTYAAETAYPTSEGTSEGLLMFAGNVGGVVLLGLASILGGNHLGVMIGMAVVSVFSVFLMFLCKEDK